MLDLQTWIAPALPDNLRFLAAPLAAGMDSVVHKAVTTVAGRSLAG